MCACVLSIHVLHHHSNVPDNFRGMRTTVQGLMLITLLKGLMWGLVAACESANRFFLCEQHLWVRTVLLTVGAGQCKIGL